MINTASTHLDLSQKLLTARTTTDVESIIASVPNRRWAPLGGEDANNYGPINVGSDAADALIEKVTNGMDAILEREAGLQNRSDFGSPREAAAQLLGVPRGNVKNLANKEERRQLAEQLIVTLRDSGSKDPTVLVEDHGIGQHPDMFPKTLVSLNQKNKREKFYLLGAYGWGGAASYAFSTYTIYISRRTPKLLAQGQRDEVGWTIVRYNDLADDRFSKTGIYEYLCLEAKSGLTIPRFEPEDLPESLETWSGTRCTLIGYQLGRYATEPTFRPSRSLYVLSNALLLDPIMPFLIRDERTKSISANKDNALEGVVIAGSAARLTWAATKNGSTKAVEFSEDPESRVAYKRSFHGTLSTGGKVTVNYWVMSESGKYKKDWEPTRSYIMPEQAVTITHNGQRHESYPRSLFEKLGLLALSKFLIVHVDCDCLSWAEKRNLFSTTRDRLKSTSVAQELRDQIDQALRSDDTLKQLEKARKERALSRRSKEQAERIKKLLEKAVAGMRAAKEIKYKVVLSSNPELPIFNNQPLLDESPNPDTEDLAPPLIEFFGDPTYLQVLNTPVHVPTNGRAVVSLKLDARDDYFDQGARFIPVVTKGTDVFRVDGFSSLRLGKMRCTIRARAASPGERGRILFTVTHPGHLPLIAEADLVVVEQPLKRVRPAGRAKSKEPGLDIQPVYKEDWGTLGFDEETVAKISPEISDRSAVTIYVNWNYPPLDEKLLSEKINPENIDSFKERFMASMGFLAWLQHESKMDTQQDELRRAAQVYLFSTLSMEA